MAVAGALTGDAPVPLPRLPMTAARRPTLVTGAAGFIGAEVVWRLLERLGGGNRSAGLRKLAERFKQDE